MNLVWHPAGVIDFVWIRLLRRFLGYTNVADVVMYLTLFWMFLWLALWFTIEFVWRLFHQSAMLRAVRTYFNVPLGRRENR